MTFGWTTMLGLGISVEDIWLAYDEEETDVEKHIWIVLHLPFCRFGYIV